MLNALDYRLNLFDFRQGRLGISRQLTDQLREYLGDVLFTGEDFVIIENERYTGLWIDLGEEKKPDDEFSLFHALRLYKRNFQTRIFPFVDRYTPYRGVDPNSFFGNAREPRTSVKVGIAHAYLLRLFHRTTVGDERFFMLRVIDYTPGVKVEVQWRELENLKEP